MRLRRRSARRASRRAPACGWRRRCRRGWRAAKWVAASSIISPAPTNSTLVWRRSSNSCDGQPHRRRRHADRMRADLGRRCALPWRPRTSAGTSAAACVPSVPALLGLAHRLLQLAEDLRLAEHHRIEPAGDAKRVARRRRRLRARRRASAACWLGTPPMPASQSTAGSTALGIGADVELGAVAGRDDRDFARPARGASGTPCSVGASCSARTRTGRAGRAARSCG